MTRWHNGIDGITSVTKEPKHSIEEFFKQKNYQPQNEEEKQVFEEFSLINSSIAILIHIAKADQVITPQEKKQIINDIIMQMEQRPYEFIKLSEKFGTNEKEIILNIYDKILKDYKANKVNLDKIIDDLCLYYRNNPEKRYYLIRLCYSCAYSDNNFGEEEQNAIKDIAVKMDIPMEELTRIRREVKYKTPIK